VRPSYEDDVPEIDIEQSRIRLSIKIAERENGSERNLQQKFPLLFDVMRFLPRAVLRFQLVRSCQNKFWTRFKLKILCCIQTLKHLRVRRGGRIAASPTLGRPPHQGGPRCKCQQHFVGLLAPNFAPLVTLYARAPRTTAHKTLEAIGFLFDSKVLVAGNRPSGRRLEVRRQKNRAGNHLYLGYCGN
jgi:hypothetical protein